ncbi:MAG: response regulator [Candidatus Binatota bacterium]
MKRKILLVEDHPANVEMLTMGLEFLGYAVTVAGDGNEAVEMAASQLPDLIVMDILLPNVNGLEAASRIRSNPKTRVIPILAATALAMPGDMEKCLESGCDAYLAKPFTPKQLAAAIEKLLKDRSEPS